MSVISCKNIKVTYIIKRNTYIDGLDGLSITFNPGRINILFGENGCGKTTLFNVIIGQLGYDGEVLFDEQDANNLTVKERKISYVPQTIYLYPKMTIFDNLSLPLKSLKLSPQKICEKIYPSLKDFGLFHIINCLPNQISIGQQQKVALLKALVTDPKIIILDEAFANIDKVTSQFIETKIKEYVNKNGANVIYATHDYNEAFRFGDYFYVISNKEIIYECSKENLNTKKVENLLINNEK